MTPLLDASGVAKAYGAVVALRSVDLTVARGEIHALLGANGAGKSTLVKILTGVVKPDLGTVSLAGVAASFSGPAAARSRGVESVFQDPALVADLTLRQNLLLTRTEVAEVKRQLANLGLEGLDLEARAGGIPLPFLRMLDLARALATDPDLLLLDEITAALPPDLSERVFGAMRLRRERGKSVLFISHRLAEVVEHCDLCTVLRDGRTVERFDASQGEDRMVSAMLGERSTVVGGRRRAAREGAVASAPAPVRLAARGLGGGRQLRDVALDVHAGEVLGVVALEGQGQDALFEMLAGQLGADRGQVLIDGAPVRLRHPYDAVRRGVALVPGDRIRALLPQRSIAENLSAPLYNRIPSWGPVSPQREREAVKRAVDRLSIDTRAAAQAQRLSGGNQQKLTIGRWLVAGFGTLLLFDPTRGIDVGTKHQIYELIAELAGGGAAILMFTSELREVALVCDRVVVLYQGAVVAEMDADADEEELLSVAHGLGLR